MGPLITYCRLEPAFTETITNISNHAAEHPSLHHLQVPSVNWHTTYHPNAITCGVLGQPSLAFKDMKIDDFMVLTQQPLQLPM
jgi:hypothetical protein